MIHITDNCDSIDDRDDSAQVRTFNSIHLSEASNLVFQSRVIQLLTNQTKLEVSVQLLVSNVPRYSSLEFSCSQVHTGLYPAILSAFLTPITTPTQQVYPVNLIRWYTTHGPMYSMARAIWATAWRKGSSVDATVVPYG